MAVYGQTLTNDRPFVNIEGYKQGGGVELVVVGQGAIFAWLHRQAGLGAVQCLNLTSLIYGKHDSLLRWFEICIHRSPGGTRYGRVLHFYMPLKIRLQIAPTLKAQYRRRLTVSVFMIEWIMWGTLAED